ncbi:hypothetical protein ACR82Z_03815 [Mycoplasma sp. 6243]|uniref:hypothetical protein n=1 Tax=Mycoplasma sp. 6243 TaxID=3440865 RepID=UPI003EB991D0
MKLQKLILINQHGKNGTIYKYVAYSNGYNKNVTKLFSLGSTEKLLKERHWCYRINKKSHRRF